MLYVIYGTDSEKTSLHSKKIVDALTKKKPDASVFMLNEDTFSVALLDEYLGASGLFEAKHIVRLDTLLTHEDFSESVLERLPLLGESEHVFVLREGALTAPIKKKVEKYAHEMRAYDVTEKKKERFNVFAITEALGNRDKKRAWMLYREALAENLVPEEIHGILWWQIKTMLQVASGDTANMKPFSVTKARTFLKKYSQTELEALARSFVNLYHDARRGIVEFEIGLEKLLLTL